MGMARPEDFEAFVVAVRSGKAGLQWGSNNVHAWAERQGWKLPAVFGVKKALLKKMAESRSNFTSAMIDAGIDVYIPDELHSDHTS